MQTEHQDVDEVSDGESLTDAGERDALEMMGEEMQGINIKRAGSKCFYRLVNFVQETWRDCVLNAMRVEGLAENSVFTTVDFVPNRQSTRSLNTNDDVFDVRLLTELNLTEQAVEKRMRGDRMTSGLTWRRLFELGEYANNGD